MDKFLVWSNAPSEGYREIKADSMELARRAYMDQNQGLSGMMVGAVPMPDGLMVTGDGGLIVKL